MAELVYKGLILSDANLANLAGYLNGSDVPPRVEAALAPFGQFMQVLLDPGHPLWEAGPDFAVVWTRPQAVSRTFARALEYGAANGAAALEEVDQFAAGLIRAAGRTRHLFCPVWVGPAYHRGLGLLDLQSETGLARLLMRMNLRLADQIAKVPNLYLLDTYRWTALAGESAFNPKLWYMGKIPFGNDVFKRAVADLKGALAGLAGRARKLVILDLDHTLWGGIVGDAGWENLVLGGHDPVGEAYVDFQKALKGLTRRGIVLGLVSKNDEATALEAIRSHPEMVLAEDDFAGWKINWRDKAQNVAELAAELNLGLDAAVFIDDNPAERARVREALPQVLVPEWPADKMLYPKALLELTCFDAPAVSPEDRDRARMYAVERRRTVSRAAVGSLDEWLKTLRTVVRVEPLTPGNLARTAQLLNKTNQMNLSTRRLSEAELAAWAGRDPHRLWTFRVADRFGDAGLTGILGLATEGRTARIIDFILSCRVMGRRIEEAMLHVAVEWARQAGMERVAARYLPTARNRPCLEFWRERSGFASPEDGHRFSWDAARPYPAPDQLKLVMAGKASGREAGMVN